jgi:hypothetical protein
MPNISPLEARIIQVARDNDTLAEVCNFIDYDPDVGSVPGHWRVRWPVFLVANTLMAQQFAPEEQKQPKAAPVKVKLTRFQYCTMAQVMHRRREQATTEASADRMNLLLRILLSSTHQPAHTFSFTPRQIDIIQVEAELITEDLEPKGADGGRLRMSMRNMITRIKAARLAHISTTITSKP